MNSHVYFAFRLLEMDMAGTETVLNMIRADRCEPVQIERITLETHLGTRVVRWAVFKKLEAYGEPDCIMWAKNGIRCVLHKGASTVSDMSPTLEHLSDLEQNLWERAEEAA